jgi:DNA polymerase V
LAKLAGYTAKKQTTTGQGAGIALISEDNLDQALSDTFIGSIWGIGTKLAHRMRREGIKTARDLVNRDDAWIRSMFGIVGLRMKAELMGSTASLVEIDQTDRQGISSTRSFGRDVCSYQELLASLIKHVEVASRKLRRQNSTAGKISIFIRTGKHKTGPQYYGKTELLLLVPTDNTLNFNKVVRQLLESVYRPGFIYYRSGVLLSNIEPKENHHPQSSWYKTEQHRYQSDTMATIDKLNNIYGNNHIRSACIPKQPSWQSKSNFKSFQQSLKDTTKLPTLHIV